MIFSTTACINEGPSSDKLTCNRQAFGRCDYSGAKNRSTRRQKQKKALDAPDTVKRKKNASGSKRKITKRTSTKKPKQKQKRSKPTERKPQKRGMPSEL